MEERLCHNGENDNDSRVRCWRKTTIRGRRRPDWFGCSGGRPQRQICYLPAGESSNDDKRTEAAGLGWLQGRKSSAADLLSSGGRVL
ncbi:unnamed protein product [Linum trigynum]|uniref:Uncharacterized protein n=1 Tax=Linum trigynum TaxID=586398 RepID=A0AAV2G9U4_9ROSI